TAINRFKLGVAEMMYLTESETALVHLTHKDCLKANRGKILGVKPYQANRKGNDPPKLLHPLRDECAKPENMLPEYNAVLHMHVEADDACMIDAYRLKDNGILMSEDKDLRQTPYPFYDNYTGKIIKAKGIGSLWEHVTEAGNTSLHGIGRIFFWAQMLMGDTADNIGGLQYFEGQRIGHKRTYQVLEGFFEDREEHAVANFVVDAFRGIDQNPIPEGYLLHMMRQWGDSFWDVCKEIDWTSKNKEFIMDCVKRKWIEE
ncbi:MAG: hypothetical protein ACRC9P_10330, partial [Bacteroides sp.]